MLSLWCIARSPLMLGCDLPSSPPETIELLTNRDVLDVLTASRNNREMLRDGHLVLWAAESTTSEDRFVAVFNTGIATLARTVPLADLGLPGPGSWTAREAWSGAGAGLTELSGAPALTVDPPAHGVQFYRFARNRD